MSSAVSIASTSDGNSLARYALEHPEELRAELSERKLRHFTKNAWPIIEPGVPFHNNWHNDAICEHLEAVLNNDIRHLLINVPPRTGKSSTISICFPVWAWMKDDEILQRGPNLKFLFTSYAAPLALDFAVSSRRLIQSIWFQRHFGHHFQLTGDQNQKSQYENNHRGYRISLGVRGGATGKGGDIILFDDPHNVKEAESDVIREETEKWYNEVMRSRLNDEATGHRIMICQRSHQRDLPGVLLERTNADDFEHLLLPMEYQGKCIVDMAHRCSQPVRPQTDPEIPGVPLEATSIGFKDPRSKIKTDTEMGELLHEARFPKEVILSLRRMGDYAYSAQYDQNPGAREGNFIKVENFEIWDEFYPDEIKAVWRAWDKAGTEGGGAYTAGVKMCLMKYYANDEDKKAKKNQLIKYGIMDVVRKQYSAGKREQLIKFTAQQDRWGLDNKKKVRVSVEQEPGSGGKESAERTKKNTLVGYHVYLDNVSTEGAKEVRADPFAVAVELGEVVLLRGDWNYDFIEECRFFPRSTYKDQVDAASQAFARLSRGTRVHFG